ARAGEGDRVAEGRPSVSVIVPAYCEAANLVLLIPRIHEALSRAGLAGEVIVVDDSSPDGTEDVCAALSRQYPVRLVVRRERGLSGAILRGIMKASAPVLVVMHADLSHPPEKIPELVEGLGRQRADFVIGSRYVAGGRPDEQWGVFRRLRSKTTSL